jgi:FkbM family methyltransferase
MCLAFATDAVKLSRSQVTIHTRESMTAPPPHLSLADRVRQRVVPRRFYFWHKHRRALRVGEREIRLVPFLARTDRVSVDVGAHKGVYTYALLEHSSAVHAFEPNPDMYQLLAGRIDGLSSKITTHPVALSDASGVAELRVPNRGQGFDHPRASLSAVTVPDDYTTASIRTMRFDDLGITNVGFMKIDVEGFEQQVLTGAAETIRRDKPNLLIELEERHTKIPITDMVGLVCARGYECLVLMRGVLTPFAMVDPERNHRNPPTKYDYINNFIFLPVPR